MATSDLIIGFIEKPEGLEVYLEELGYCVDNASSDERVIAYENEKAGWPSLDYYKKPSIDEKGVFLNESLLIDSVLWVNYRPISDHYTDDLWHGIVRKYNAVMYDCQERKFCYKRDLLSYTERKEEDE